MRVWWCNQSVQWEVEWKNEVVCSSDPTADGGNATYRKSVAEAKAGDLIVHYRKPQVAAFSRAREDGSRHDRLPLLGDDDYGSGWRFRTEYFRLARGIPREAFAAALASARAKDYPIDRRGFVRQGYFFPFDLRGLAVILAHVEERLPAWLDVHRPGGLQSSEEPLADPALWEGALTRVTANAYERNPEARRRCIEHYGTRCVACGIDLGEVYGKVAEGLIHIHHLKPISEIGESYVVHPINDLRPVCPNCHAVIHLRNDSPYDISDIIEFLKFNMISENP